jgi:hypothetical protein
MEIGWSTWYALWLALGLAWFVNLVLLVWSLRLRMEVWANRRVIAALEAAAQHSAEKGYSNRTNGVMLAFFVIGLLQLLLFLREFWR